MRGFRLDRWQATEKLDSDARYVDSTVGRQQKNQSLKGIIITSAIIIPFINNI